MAITFSQTARDVVTGAMRDLGIIRVSGTPKASEMAYGIEQLNLMLKGLAVEGLSPWTDMEATAVVPATTSTVTLTPRPVDVSEVRLQETGYQRPLARWEAGEYDLLPNKAQAGVPLAYQVIHTVSDVQLRLWPVPSVETTLAYSYQRVIEDVGESTVLDVPQVWGEAIRAMLKPRLTAFGPISQDVTIRAEMLKRQMIDFDRPASYHIEPDFY